MGNKLVSYTKDRHKLKYRGTECKNCGRLLEMSDKYCPNCSQANSTKKLTIKDFFDEFFSNIISYDSKLLKTLAAMLWRPGKITKDYINGKRVCYTNPFRFLLSLAIIYFLIWNFTSNYSELDRYGFDNGKSTFLNDDGSLKFSIGDEEQQKELQMVMDTLKINETVKLANEAKKQKDSIILSDPKFHFRSNADNSFIKRLVGKYQLFSLLLNKGRIKTLGEASEKYSIEDDWENRTTFNIASSVIKFTKQPGSFLSDLISKLPFATFFFLPIFAIFILLAYIRKKYNYTDHLIFSFHNQSLLFILLIISFLLDWIFGIDSGWIFIMIFSIYLFMAMRKFYGQGVFKTIVKYIFLNTIFFILAGISVVLLFTGSLFTY